ncbi:MAG TPA: ATP-binding cassette domain-containing protein [Gaiellaceae bacterium]|nr:ATP-binding cassette domain-containing protein [Gaiellaceae bacterium]
MTAAAAAVVQTRNALAGAVRDVRAGWTSRATAGVALVALAALLPALPLEVGLDRLAGDLYLGAAAVGLGVIVGLGGMPSLGQGAFVAVGAFGTALLTSKLGWPDELALAGAALVAAAAGGAVGLVAARLRPAIVAVVTWLLAWLVAIGLAAFPSISGGAQGIAVEEGSIAGLDLSPAVRYELGVALAALAVLIFAVLARSPVGVTLSAASQDRTAAESLGAPVARLRAATFALGAGIGGLAGGFGVLLAGVADAEAYGPLLSAKLFIAVVLGGAVAPAGGLVGVAMLAALGRLVELGGVEGLQASRLETLLVAVIVLAALGAVDRGLLPLLGDWNRRRRGGTAAAATPSTARPTRVGVPASVRALGLTKRFGAVTALADVDLDVPAATVHAIIGPNGSGKTTALRVVAGAIDPDAGTVTVDGRDVSGDAAWARAETGVVGTLQATAVFPELTALDNALVGAGLRVRHRGVARAVLATPKARSEAHVARNAAKAALEVVGLGAVADVPAGELPGSAQRRLMIAAALATRPRVLLLDEPTAGADRSDIELLTTLLRDLRASGLTIVLVEHNLRLVRSVAERATVLEAGRAIAAGAIGEVLEDEAVLRAYLGGRPR